MSENLTKLAHKIDFSKDESEEKGKPTSEGERDDQEDSASAIQPALWPWDSVWNKLRYVVFIMFTAAMFTFYTSYFPVCCVCSAVTETGTGNRGFCQNRNRGIFGAK